MLSFSPPPDSEASGNAFNQAAPSVSSSASSVPGRQAAQAVPIGCLRQMKRFSSDTVLVESSPLVPGPHENSRRTVTCDEPYYPETERTFVTTTRSGRSVVDEVA